MQDDTKLLYSICYPWFIYSFNKDLQIDYNKPYNCSKSQGINSKWKKVSDFMKFPLQQDRQTISKYVSYPNHNLWLAIMYLWLIIFKRK